MSRLGMLSRVYREWRHRTVRKERPGGHALKARAHVPTAGLDFTQNLDGLIPGGESNEVSQYGGSK